MKLTKHLFFSAYKFTDDFDNVLIRDVQRPACISMYFRSCSKIDHHNQARQGFLRLEKHWPTQSGWFRIFTTLIGMTVTDAWLAMRAGLGAKHRLKNIPIVYFAGILAKQLCDGMWCTESNPGIFIQRNGVIPTEIGARTMAAVVSPLASEQSESSHATSFFNTNGSSVISSSECVSVPPNAPHINENYREKHRRITKQNERQQCKEPRCMQLTKKKKSGMYCVSCNKCFCADNTGRYCFYAHICHHYVKHMKPSAQFKTAYKEWCEGRGELFETLE